MVSPFGVDGDLDGLHEAPPTLDGELDGAVGQGLLDDAVAPLAGLDRGLLDGVGLEEAVELLLRAPAAVVVVVADAGRSAVSTDDGVEPAGQLDEQPGGLALEQPGGAVDGLGQAEAAAGGGDRRGVADLGLDRHDVAHGWDSWLRGGDVGRPQTSRAARGPSPIGGARGTRRRRAAES